MWVVTDSIRCRSEADRLGTSAHDALDRQRAALERTYGWTGMELTVIAERSTRQLVVRGTVLVRGVAKALRQSLSALVGPGWRLNMAGVTAWSGHEWRAIRCPVLRVWRQYDVPESTAALATELVAADGPVQILARLRAATLIRGTDGTVGWIYESLGSQTPAFNGRTTAARPRTMRDALRSRLGTPYLLGGTTSALDCSGLVQRVYREALGVTIPRHSTDQRRGAQPITASGRQTGDLVFLWSRAEAPCHVGVVLTGSADHTVVHASESRRMVVEDALDAFVAGATRVEYRPMASAAR